MKIYTHEELSRLDPAQLIQHDRYRPMTVLEVIRHLIDGNWPDATGQATTPRPEVTR
jgi:hypothetical protein